MALDKTKMNLLKEIAGLEAIPEGAYNLRDNGKTAERRTTANIDIVSKTDKPGIDIYVKAGTKGERVLNPTTLIEIDDGGSMTMETAQIRGVDSTVRTTKAKLADRAVLIIHEKIMTHGKQYAKTDFSVSLDGVDSAAHVVSRSIAKDDSHQIYISCVDGNNRSSGHTECDAIIMDNGTVTAEPRLNANNIEASLIHEAAIGKIAGEQLIKLMTLGLTEKEAEEEIVNGFLK